MAWINQKTPSQNENSTFRSVRGSHSYHIGNKPFDLHGCHIGYQSTLFLLNDSKLRAQVGVLPTSQSGSRTTNVSWIGKETAPPKSPPKSMFRSVRATDSWYIGKQPLCVHQMTLSKVTRAQEGGSASQSGSPTQIWPKLIKKHRANFFVITPQIAHSALSGDPTIVILATNHSIFIKWP